MPGFSRASLIAHLLYQARQPKTCDVSPVHTTRVVEVAATVIAVVKAASPSVFSVITLPLRLTRIKVRPFRAADDVGISTSIAPAGFRNSSGGAFADNG